MDVKKQENIKHTVINIGSLLVEARESKELSAQDIADQLNLTLTVVNKIENNEFKQDIPLAFIRGYLRSYAHKVGADTETLSVEFDRQTEVDDEPIQKIKVVSSFKSSRREMNSNHFPFKIVTYIIVISLLSFGGWEVWKRFGAKKFGFQSSTSDSLVNEIQLNTELTSASAQLNDSEQLAQNDDTDGELLGANEINLEVDAGLSNGQVENEESDPKIVSEIKDNVTDVLQLDAANSSEVENDVNFLNAQFIFSDDCWVKVTDANGEVLAVGVKQNGKVMPLTGPAPWSVILGNPATVNLTVEGKAFDLSTFNPGKRAEFSLESVN